MATVAETELEAFHQFVTRQLAEGDKIRVPEDVVQEWRSLWRNAQAIRKTLENVADGATRPMDDVIRDFEQRHFDKLH